MAKGRPAVIWLEAVLVFWAGATFGAIVGWVSRTRIPRDQDQP